MSVEKAPTQDSINYINKRIDKINSKLRLLISALIDKKVLGEDFGKTLISETAEGKLIEWFLNEKEMK